MEKIKVIKIDSYAKNIEEIEINPVLEDFYATIGKGCDMVQVVPMNNKVIGQGNILLVDEEGLFKHHTQGFNISSFPQTLLGNGIIIGYDLDGNERSYFNHRDRLIETLQYHIGFVNIKR